MMIAIEEAERLTKEGVNNIITLEGDHPFAYEFAKRMDSHVRLVANAARLIASKTVYLNPDKAYIYGLMHDHGRYFGDVLGKRTFHGWVGYEKLKEMGYEDVAKISLTHTFLVQDFKLEDYASYPQEDLLKTKEILNKIELDDYDRLIQLCDLLPKMFGGYNTIEVRFLRIQTVYKLSPEVTKQRINEALELKKYFDEKCNCDIYELLKAEKTGDIPTRAEAEQLWEDGIRYRLTKPYGFRLEDEYRFHTKGVAIAAEKIAKHIKGMDSEKAYVMGLLHDYGKRISERQEKKFHGQEGYEQLMLLGFPEIARICLTHTFPSKDFDEKQYYYPQEWKDWAKKEMQTIEYNDYDYLIGFCDKLFEGLEMVNVKHRINKIAERYGLDECIKRELYNDSMKLKNYFDEKTGQDVYKILGIRE